MENEKLKLGVTAGFVFAHVWDRATIKDWLKCIRKAGEMNFVRVGLEIFYEHQEPIFAGANLLEIKRMLDDYNLQVGQFVAEYAFQNLFSLKKDERNKGVDQIKLAIDICLKLERPRVIEIVAYAPREWVALGAKIYKGFLGKTKLPDQAGYYDFWQAGVESVGRCLQAVRQAGLVLAIEPKPNTMLTTVDSLLRFMNEFPVDAPLQAVLDICHLEAQREMCDVAIEKMAGRIAGIHVADHHPKRYREIPGQGSVNWDVVFRSLKKNKYHGPLDIELFGNHIKDVDRVYLKAKRFVETKISNDQNSKLSSFGH